MQSSTQRLDALPTEHPGQPRQASTCDRTGPKFAERGFTLIELMTTVSIALILLMIGVPNFSTMIKSNTLSVEANELAMTLALARSEARSRKQTVVVCKSDDQESCSAAEEVHWEDGWITFVDDDGNQSRTDTELLLRATPSLSGSNTLRADPVFSDYIAFQSDGRCFGNGNTTAPTDGDFRLCDDRGAAASRRIEVSPIGKARVDPDHGTASCP